jgi:hypothetical protein
VPGGNDTTLRTRITCDLGANYTWIAADRVDITIPVTVMSTARGNVTNVVTAIDSLGRNATDDHIAAVEAAPLVRGIRIVHANDSNRPCMPSIATACGIVRIELMHLHPDMDSVVFSS